MGSEKTQKSNRDWGLIQKKDKQGNLDWYARIIRTGNNGKKKEYTAKAESKSHAKRLRDELSDSFKERGEQAIEGNKMTFLQLADQYQQKRLYEAVYQGEGKNRRKIGGLRSLKPVLNYLEVLKGFYGTKLLRNITHSDIEQFKINRLKTPSRRGERSIGDVNRSLALLKTMMKFAVQNKWIAQSAFEMGQSLISVADEIKRERVLSIEEEERLLLACYGRRSHLKPLIIIAV